MFRGGDGQQISCCALEKKEKMKKQIKHWWHNNVSKATQKCCFALLCNTPLVACIAPFVLVSATGYYQVLAAPLHVCFVSVAVNQIMIFRTYLIWSIHADSCFECIAENLKSEMNTSESTVRIWESLARIHETCRDQRSEDKTSKPGFTTYQSPGQLLFS